MENTENKVLEAANGAEQKANDKPNKNKTKADLEAENAALLAQLEALQAAKNTDAAAGKEGPSEPVDNRVEVYIPKGNANDDPNLLIGFNGKNYVLPKGQTSLVPPEIYGEIMRSRKAQDHLDRRIDKLKASN